MYTINWYWNSKKTNMSTGTSIYPLLGGDKDKTKF